MNENAKHRFNKDPFGVDPLPRAHYHPSRQKQLSQEIKKTAISPRRKERTADTPPMPRPLSPTDEMFLQSGVGIHLRNPVDPGVEDDNFDESWPSTERPSTAGLTDHEDTSPFSITKLLQTKSQSAKLADLKTTLDFHETSKGEMSNLDDRRAGVESSTLQRYIERFRKGTPMSREERQRKSAADPKDFWWISEDGSKTRGKISRDGQTDGLSEARLAEFSKQFEKRPQKFVPPQSPGTERTRALQERAERILEKSVSSVGSSEPIVSTDGLGSTVGSMDSPRGTVSSFDEQPYRPVFARGNVSRMPERSHAPKPDPAFQRIKKPARPEDDILYQWRIKRRLEVARTAADKTPVANKFGFLSKTKQEAEIESKIEKFTKRLTGDPTPPVSFGSVQFTPTPRQQTGSFQNMREQQLTEKEYSKKFKQDDKIADKDHPKIASPLLKRKIIGDTDNLEPHLHLMCDLLPCPHQERYVNITQSGKYDKGQGESYGRKQEDSLGRQGGKEKMEETTPGDIISDTKESAERYRYLEAEKPDEGRQEVSEKFHRDTVDDRVHSGRRLDYADTRENDDDRRRMIKTRTDDEDDVSEKSSGSRKSYRSDRSEKSRTSERSRTSGRSRTSDKSSRSEPHSERSSKSESRDSTHRISKYSSTEKQSRSSSANKLDLRHNGAKENPQEGTEQGVRGQSSRGADTEVRGQRSTRPQRSKSPTAHTYRKPVDSAIGQVIKDRLFTSSIDTVTSSVDSSVSQSQRVEQSHDLLPRKQQSKKAQSTAKKLDKPSPPEQAPIDDEGDGYESDGAFHDDQLLSMLRKQRALFEHQLSEIDDLLSSMASS